MPIYAYRSIPIPSLFLVLEERPSGFPSCARPTRGVRDRALRGAQGIARPSFFFLDPSSPVLEGVAKAALDCAQHSHPPNPERDETRSCPRRVPFYRARSASKKAGLPLPAVRPRVSASTRSGEWSR